MSTAFYLLMQIPLKYNTQNYHFELSFRNVGNLKALFEFSLKNAFFLFKRAKFYLNANGTTTK